MPYIITKMKNIDEQNAFYKKCGKDGFIPVICEIKGSKANIHADVHALDQDNVRDKIRGNEHLVSEIERKVFDRFSPTAKSWSFGYYCLIEDLDADIAQEMSAILAGELDAFIIKLHRGA
tara:strand:- start:4330 stop:4689 length:360 start_codon:yes stop_codon:yes gene_type:complete